MIRSSFAPLRETGVLASMRRGRWGNEEGMSRHAGNVAERLLDDLMRIDEIRGAGRIYVP